MIVSQPNKLGSLIVAIDPGKSGGIAWRYAGGTVACVGMPSTEAEVVAHLQELSGWGDSDRVAYIEKVSGHWLGAPATKGFAFGRNCGLLMGALFATDFRIIEVIPSRWQKELGCFGIDLKKRKNEFKNRAHQFFPRLGKGITLKTADALLIFEYACRIESARTH